MPLGPGAKFGPYEVLGPLGAGGMGEVYRAHDPKLKRDVAIKVMPESFARDEERMRRFEREAQVLASLNHPHIAAIYGLEEADGVRALVLELVEGPTLAERIARGPVPLEEAVRIAVQIAHGLEMAHEKAIIHRDLKPANLKLTRDGDVKILDFGLAKALDVESSAVDNTSSPTLSRAATNAGVLLGTAAYMSPEQAKGKPADRRADVWAFGVVLYEMLAGGRAFAGEDVSETLAFVLTREPDWSALPEGLPSWVRGLLGRCLTKDPKKRLQAIGEARIAMESATEGAPEATVARPRSASPLWPALVGVGGLALGVGATLLAIWPRPAPPPSPLVRLSAELGAGASLVYVLGLRVLALSPDGAELAFVGLKDPRALPQLYLRRLEELKASPLSGTEGARNPFFSPDGQWIAFFVDGNLKKISVTGGAAITLCEARDDRGGTWGEDGTIIFSQGRGNGSSDGGLSRVSSAGGAPEVLTNPDASAGEIGHYWPQVLPGGKAVLYTTAPVTGTYQDTTIVSQPLPSGPKQILLRGGYHGRYLPSGHLVYMREGTLFAVAFDVGRMQVTGPRAPAVEGVTSSASHGGAQFAASDRGTLAYVPGENRDAAFSIEWVDSAGRMGPLRATPGDYADLRFSPDGHRLALDIRDRDQRDVWVYDWERGALSRLTFDPTNDTRPVWTPDGRRIAFSSERAEKGIRNLYWQRADGTGEAERITVSNNHQWPGSWHPSGKFLAFSEIVRPKSSPDIMILPMEGSEASGWKPGKPTVFLNSPSVQNTPEFSPDGRWLAYMSNESGRFEVYVRPFPGPGGRWQVSTEGGKYPMWSRSHPEIFYSALDQRIMVAPYTLDGNSFRAEKPRRWSEGLFTGRPTSFFFDLHPDGKRFALIKATEGPPEVQPDKVVFILNFFDYLRRIAPPNGAK
jgi:Tol biopolymer transport system component